MKKYRKTVLNIFVIFLSLILCIIIGLPLLNKFLNYLIHTNASIIHTKITSEYLKGELDLQYDEKDNYYWLYYNYQNKTKLIWQDNDINGYINVKVSGVDKIDIQYKYFENLSIPLKDKTVTLDIGKGETYKTSFWRSFVE